MPNVPVSLGGLVTLTNVGNSYDAIASSKGLGSALIDFEGVESIQFRVGVNKVGTGTQSWQLWNVTDGAEIGVLDDAGTAGERILSATFSGAAVPSGVKLVRVRAKSTTVADDPVYYGATLLLVYPACDFERLGLFEQFLRNLYQLVRDMRDNAGGYKARLLPPFDHTPAQVAATMVADAGQYLARIQWLNDLFTRNLTISRAMLGIYGIPMSAATALRDTLTTVAEHTQAATLTTVNEVNAEADYVLANVPNYERLW